MLLSFPRRSVLLRVPTFAAATILGLYSFINLPAQEPPSPQVTPTTEAPKPESQNPRPTARQIRDAQDAYIAGARLLDRGNLLAAEAMFSKAAKLNPEDT